MQAVTYNSHPCQLQDGLEKNNEGPTRTQQAPKSKQISSHFTFTFKLLSRPGTLGYATLRPHTTSFQVDLVL